MGAWVCTPGPFIHTKPLIKSRLDSEPGAEVNAGWERRPWHPHAGAEPPALIDNRRRKGSVLCMTCPPSPSPTLPFLFLSQLPVSDLPEPGYRSIWQHISPASLFQLSSYFPFFLKPSPSLSVSQRALSLFARWNISVKCNFSVSGLKEKKPQKIDFSI